MSLSQVNCSHKKFSVLCCLELIRPLEYLLGHALGDLRAVSGRDYEEIMTLTRLWVFISVSLWGMGVLVPGKCTDSYDNDDDDDDGSDEDICAHFRWRLSNDLQASWLLVGSV